MRRRAEAGKSSKMQFKGEKRTTKSAKVMTKLRPEEKLIKIRISG